MNMRFAPLLFCFSLIVSCVEEQPVNIPYRHFSESEVVNALWNTDDTVKIQLLYSNKPDENKYNPVTDALVYLIHSGNKMSFTDRDSQGYYYFDCKPKTGETVGLEIHHGNRMITGEDSVPEPVRVSNIVLHNNVGVDQDGEILSEIEINFEKSMKGAFVEIKLLDYHDNLYIEWPWDTVPKYNPRRFFSLQCDDDMITSQGYYPSVLTYGKDFPYSLLYDDRDTDNPCYTLHVRYYPPTSVYLESAGIEEHKMVLYVNTVSESYFRYKTSQITQAYNIEGDILYGTGEPVPVFSNIENGMGIFACFSQRADTLICKP